MFKSFCGKHAHVFPYYFDIMRLHVGASLSLRSAARLGSRFSVCGKFTSGKSCKSQMVGHCGIQSHKIVYRVLKFVVVRFYILLLR